MEKAIPTWRKHHKEQGFGSKVKIPKTTQALRENQVFGQENTRWWDLLIRSVQAESLEQVHEGAASSEGHAAPCAPRLRSRHPEVTAVPSHDHARPPGKQGSSWEMSKAPQRGASRARPLAVGLAQQNSIAPFNL